MSQQVTLKDAIWKHGYNTGAIGGDKDECPYPPDADEYEWWMDGFFDGKEDWCDD
jgi:ribosome modulation factor